MDKNAIMEALVKRESELENQVKELQEAQIELKGIKEAIKALGGHSPAINGYNSSWPWRQKIVYAIKELNEGSVVDIVNAIRTKEPSIPADKAYNNVATISSIMAKNHQIRSKKHGLRKIYFL